MPCLPQSAPKPPCPIETVIAIDGDGCFQMTFQELITAAVEDIPVKICVMNNANLGMVRQWQKLFYDERYSATELSGHDQPRTIVKLAEAMGCVGLRAEHAVAKWFADASRRRLPSPTGPWSCRVRV